MKKKFSRKLLTYWTPPEDCNFKRKIVCAANKYGDFILVGPRHWAPTMLNTIHFMSRNAKKYMNSQEEIQGFIDQNGHFLDRKEAYKVAIAAGQLKDKAPCRDYFDAESTNVYEPLLFSEDLY